MGNGLFFRLAVSNLSRNKKLYLPYCIASVVMVAVYFMCLIVMYSDGIANVPTGRTLQQMFSIGFVVMTVFAVLFMLYVNSFLIKRRKKEFGLYGVLGLEKRHVSRVIAWENLIVNFSSLLVGIAFGCVFGRLLFMLLLTAMEEMAEGSRYLIPSEAFIFTFAVFVAIFLLTTVYNMFHVRLANPIDLLHGAKKGEKKVRFAWLQTILGVALLGWAYYTAITVKDPRLALIQFMFAVIAVMIGTNLLFRIGSQVLLKMMRANKKFYYKPGNFISVSGMFHRMKQNAAGLATICILSTMVLVTVSSCCALYIGQKDILSIMYPDDFSVIASEEVTLNELNEMDELISSLCEKHNITFEGAYRYRVLSLYAGLKDGRIFNPLGNYEEFQEYLYDFWLITLEDFNRITGMDRQLSDGEILILTNGKIEEINNWTVKETIADTPFTKGKNGSPYRAVVLVAKDEDAALEMIGQIQPDSEESVFELLTVFNIGGEKNDALAFAEEFRDQVFSIDNVHGIADVYTYRMDSIGLYGGLLFLGAFFAVLFLTATVLIIYFKQISEGYDDAERFEILQKVGMDDKEVKRTINKQILIVFFLPLIGALLNISAAGNMIIKLLEMFSLYNVALTAACIAATCLLFAAVYVFVYRQTAKTYYRLVKW